ncbi:hypothetical protein [Roseomonas mucosa]|uniref:hypothetical protein n=1 Tax=Roseomonas mucosa TaxID=207340 RepID=UPI0011C07F34|nr:hypothetical protein [Roseomonas mucosa]QDE01469.1 hypothetical protein ADP8_05078 [Roseomonas mucosa]
MSKQCIKTNKFPLVSVKENKRQATFKNPERKPHKIVEIDGCLIDGSEEIKCDYLVSEIGSSSVLIELKGGDVEHGCEQLLATAEHDAIRPLLEKRVAFLMICSKYPRFDSFVAKAKQKCAKKYKTGFHVLCDRRELEMHRVMEIDGPY